MASYRPQAIFSLTGRVALVTGGATGIGWMITQGLAASGAKVYIAGRRAEVLQKAAAQWDKSLGGEVIPYVIVAAVELELDVTSKQSIQSVKSIIEQKEGKLHVLINNAGQVGPVARFLNNTAAPEHSNAETLGQALFDNEEMEQWAQLYTTNIFSIYFVTTAFLGLLAKGSEDVPGYWSSVVNITSISGVTKLAQNHFCYNSSKAALSHLTKMLSTELLLKKIPVRVNAIGPGVFESELTAAKIDDPNWVAKGITDVPAGRPGSGEEMAGTVLYLVSKAGGYTHGREIVVDGGYMAVNPGVV